MAVNKDKIIASAQKYVQKGQLDKAIREYARILEEDPKEVRTLLKIGDLYSKMGQAGDACQTYLKVAEFYSEQGFYLKAVAVYKQILKIDADLVTVNVKLADLYQQLGLLQDAIVQFQQVAAHYERVGQSREAVDVLKRMLELDPENIASRIKLAEAFSKEGRTTEAATEFARACTYLKQQNRADDFVKVAERLVFHDTTRVDVMRDLARIYLQKGDTKRALSKLQVCFKAMPRDAEVLDLLARAFQDLGQGAKTLSVLRELAKVQGEAGRTDLQAEAYRRLLRLAPDDDEARRALGMPMQAAAAPPPPAAPAARAAVPVAPAAAPQPSYAAPAFPAGPEEPAYPTAPAEAMHQSYATAANISFTSELPAQAPPVEQVSAQEKILKLLTETDVYIKYGLREKALDHLRKIFTLSPQNLEAHEKVKDIYLGAGDIAGAAQELLNMAQIAQRGGDNARALAYLQEGLRIEPDNEDLTELAQQLGGAPPPRPAHHGEDGQVIELEDEAFVGGPPAEEDEQVLVASDDMLEGDDVVLDDGGAYVSVGSNRGQRLEDLAEVNAAAEFDLDAPAQSPDVGHIGGYHIGVEEDDELIVPASEDALDDPPPARAANGPDAMQQGFVGAGAEFDDHTGFGAPNADFDTMEVELDEPHEELTEPGLGLDLRAPSASDEVEEEVTPMGYGAGVQAAPRASARAIVEEPAEEDALEVEEREEPGAPGFADLAEELDEADFFIQQGLNTEALELLQSLLAQHPEHPQVAERLRTLQIHPSSDDAGSEDEFEMEEGEEEISPAPAVAEEPSEDFGDVQMDIAADIAAEFASEPLLTPNAEFQISVDEVLSEFKKGVKRTVSDEDYATHYDLGIAYKEMGLVEDALHEFEVAMRAPEREIDSCTMMGMCLMDQDRAAEAAVCFERGLKSQRVTPKQTVGLRYELAASLEKVGRLAESLQLFEQVAADDPAFRDAGARITELRPRVPKTPEPAPAPRPAPASATNLAPFLSEGDATRAPPPPPRKPAGEPQPSGKKNIGYV